MITSHRTSRKTLFEELRLIERSESEVSGTWKGLHLLLFVLAFVFGSFCTLCFHVLMYFFEEKCVLFPKLLSLRSLRHNVIFELVPEEDQDSLPVDFVSTQWVEDSKCYLPMYVPLVSSIFGLVWTTMFLMCTSGGRTLSGLRRPWRVILPVLVFSVAMSAVSVYTSVVTHCGLHQLCTKLGEITGSTTYSYTVNVATILYQRRIRGVYQAIQLTIATAWLHTLCWVLSAVVALLRVLLVVDFQLVKINVELVGDVDKMLERNEQHIRTVSPNASAGDKDNHNKLTTNGEIEIHFQTDSKHVNDIAEIATKTSKFLYMSDRVAHSSALSLVPDEEKRLARLRSYANVPKDKKFIVKMIYDLIETINLLDTNTSSINPSESSLVETISQMPRLGRQYGQQKITSLSTDFNISELTDESFEKAKPLIELKSSDNQIIDPNVPSTSKNKAHIAFESVLNITEEMKLSLKSKNLDEKVDNKPSEKKSNLKHISVQTDAKSKKPKQKVKISESRSTFMKEESDASSASSTEDKETQTPAKEKQD